MRVLCILGVFVGIGYFLEIVFFRRVFRYVGYSRGRCDISSRWFRWVREYVRVDL